MMVQIALRALEATGGDTTPEKLSQALIAADFEAPQDRVRFDPETNCAIRSVYIAKVDKVEGEFAWVPVYTYKDVPPRGY